MSDADKQNTHGTPGENEEADTASGGAPEKPDSTEQNPDSTERQDDTDSKDRQ
ncbi:hypothetical protein [Agromyces sp. NPDC058110]|uniref:hypothetical protein n=1 Tax=Agromyces sp. NPDC058110 TaxID=3346345 RepID=UPI0036DD8248